MPLCCFSCRIFVSVLVPKVVVQKAEKGRRLRGVVADSVRRRDSLVMGVGHLVRQDVRAVDIAAAGGHHLAVVVAGGGVDRIALVREMVSRWPGDGVGVGAAAGSPPPFASVGSEWNRNRSRLVGGWSTPGLLDSAHGGVLCVDAGEPVPVAVQDALRPALLKGEFRIQRLSDGEVRVRPASFQMVAAMACRCAGAASDGCGCWGRWSCRYLGWLAHRFDVVAVLPAGTASAGLAADAVSLDRVVQARAVAAERWAAEGFVTNAEAARGAGDGVLGLMGSAGRAVLLKARDRGLLGAHGVVAAAGVAWTLCDLDGRGAPDEDDAAAAVSLRGW